MKKFRLLIGILKDNLTLLKLSLSLNHPTSSAAIHRAVLHATSFSALDTPPSTHHLLLLHHPIALSSTVSALVKRLHSTNNASVALKCLISLHHLISLHRLSYLPTSNGHDVNPNRVLVLSDFRDDSDVEAWELSTWVRWYGEVLEQKLYRSRNLDKWRKLWMLSNTDLLRELEVLVRFLEQICGAPESLYLQKNDLVYEVMKLVREDYGTVRFEILSRLGELGERLENWSCSAELAQLLSWLNRLESCRERLVLVFGNRKNNDGLWDKVRDLKVRVSGMKERVDGWKMVRKE